MSDHTTNTTAVNGEKRVVVAEKSKGLSVRDLMLAAILLAAGQVLKVTVGTAIASATGGAIKPNFIIAMYCLAILLIRPNFPEAAIIGILAGAVNQIMPATPLINFGSELVGAIVICLIVMIPLEKTKMPAPLTGFLKTTPGTFIATLTSGFTFVALQYLLLGVKLPGAQKPISLPDGYLVVFLGVIFGTATINAVIVQVLYPALKRVLKK
ncbi:MAG: hypothetical protein LBJ12_03405 [Oscillospiraceae bacterium]|jgi:hypothetical protein|nr:hypothetical protein [Oscillospiraceae bacterium]